MIFLHASTDNYETTNVYDLSKSFEYNLDWIANVAMSDKLNIQQFRVSHFIPLSTQIEILEVILPIEDIDDFVNAFMKSPITQASLVGIYKDEPFTLGLNLETGRIYLSSSSKKFKFGAIEKLLQSYD